MELNIKRKLIIIEASTWRRLFAFMIDYIIINSLILFPFNNLIQKMFSAESLPAMISMISSQNINLNAVRIISLAMGIISMLYFTIIEWKFNQTIGKIIMRIFVISDNKKPASKNIPKITFNQSLLRSSFIALLFIFPPVALFDIIFMLFNKEKQRLTEKLSKTKTAFISIM